MTTRIRYRLVAGMLLLAVFGCHRAPTPPKSAKGSHAPGETDAVGSASIRAEQQQQGDSDQEHASTTAAEAPNPSAAATSSGIMEQPDPDAAESDAESFDWTMADVPAYRFVLLTNRCPLLVELRAMAEGRSLDEAALQAAESVLPYLDQNRDQRITWNETAESGLVAALVGGLPVPRGQQRDVLFRSYDANANQTVDPHELIRFLNRGFPSRNWLVIRSSLTDDSEFDSALARSLDSNRDQQLDNDEIEQAATCLRMLDADDDGVLLASECAGSSLQEQAAMEADRAARDQPIFLLADAEPDFAELLFRLQEKYSMGAPLLAQQLNAWPQAWQALDASDDGVVWDDELTIIQGRDADLTVKLRIGSKSSNFSGSQVRAESPALHVHERTGQSCEVELGHDVMRITIQLSEQGGDPDNLSLIIDRADTDADGRLSAAEFESVPLGIGFQLLDVDTDGQLCTDEIERLSDVYAAMALLRLEVIPQSGGDGLFAAVDENRDGRLSVSEIATSPQQLQELDQDGDARIQPAESKPGFDLALRLGGGQFNPASSSMAVTPAQRQTAPTAPVWFRAMDGNHDGGIQRREFLGRMSDFERADLDGNGSISIVEADKLAAPQR